MVFQRVELYYLVVAPKTASATPKTSPTPPITPTPGFEAVFAVTALLAVIYGQLRKRRA